MSIRKAKFSLDQIAEHKDEDFLSKRWEDFDHSQKMGLGVWGTAWTVRDRSSSLEYVLQSCHQSEWSLPRWKLLELAKRRVDLFVAPKFMFFRNDTVYHDWYKRDSGSRYYQAGAFGRKLRPRDWETEHPSTCELIGHLVYHMLTRFPRIIEEHEVEPSDQLIMIRTASVTIPISPEHQLTSSFFDFLQGCMDDVSSMGDIANVSTENAPKADSDGNGSRALVW
ncbi:hypothetical protein L207DRAFT_527248 [Hyaloscypha variabilis F]|uniref:Uncharacterized protein n=1 Tax=Hyaloscypha variabilis (strain UAMH 11265 / GT02V1 / F) TaxID=1149755 RepID=A0A2J6RUY4_HYAVF|nr:hypothetical protein L207DRAFT_527248 [Hyaloscypha variabilis F]